MGLASGIEFSSPGWVPLVVELDAALRAIDPDFTSRVVKQKFAGLRVEARPSQALTEAEREQFGRLIREAEDNSLNICEWCASTDDVTAPPRIAGRGWIRTLCATCRATGTNPLRKPVATVEASEMDQDVAAYRAAKNEDDGSRVSLAELHDDLTD